MLDNYKKLTFYQILIYPIKISKDPTKYVKRENRTESYKEKLLAFNDVRKIHDRSLFYSRLRKISPSKNCKSFRVT